MDLGPIRQPSPPSFAPRRGGTWFSAHPCNVAVAELLAPVTVPSVVVGVAVLALPVSAEPYQCSLESTYDVMVALTVTSKIDKLVGGVLVRLLVELGDVAVVSEALGGAAAKLTR